MIIIVNSNHMSFDFIIIITIKWVERVRNLFVYDMLCGGGGYRCTFVDAWLQNK